MQAILSAAIVLTVTITLGVFLVIVARNELVIKDKTGGYAVPVVIGLAIILVILPLLVFLLGG